MAQNTLVTFTQSVWSHGSVGRAHRSHRWGHRFESCCDHQHGKSLRNQGLSSFLYSPPGCSKPPRRRDFPRCKRFAPSTKLRDFSGTVNSYAQNSQQTLRRSPVSSQMRLVLQAPPSASCSCISCSPIGCLRHVAGGRKPASVRNCRRERFQPPGYAAGSHGSTAR